MFCWRASNYNTRSEQNHNNPPMLHFPRSVVFYKIPLFHYCLLAAFFCFLKVQRHSFALARWDGNILKRIIKGIKRRREIRKESSPARLIITTLDRLLVANPSSNRRGSRLLRHPSPVINNVRAVPHAGMNHHHHLLSP